MPTLNLLISIAAFIVVTLLILFFAFPGGTEKAKRKKVKPKEPLPQADKTEDITLKFEKHIHSLHMELEKLRSEQRNTLKELAREKAKSTKLQEKVLQEKGWFEKEKDSIDKKTEEVHQLKEGLVKAEAEFDNEYSLRLRFERELKEVRQQLEGLEKDRRDLYSRLTRAEAGLESYKKESADLKRLNAEISKKNDETAWVAKAEYEKLEKLLVEKEKEFERLRRNTP